MNRYDHKALLLHQKGNISCFICDMGYALNIYFINLPKNNPQTKNIQRVILNSDIAYVREV